MLNQLAGFIDLTFENDAQERQKRQSAFGARDGQRVKFGSVEGKLNGNHLEHQGYFFPATLPTSSPKFGKSSRKIRAIGDLVNHFQGFLF